MLILYVKNNSFGSTILPPVVTNILLQQGLATGPSTASQAGWWKQLTTLTKRSFVNMSRDMGYYWLRIIIYIVVSICVGTIFYDVGTSYTAILARGACGGFITGFMTFMSIGSFPSFIEDMKVPISELLLHNRKHQISYYVTYLFTLYR